MSEGLDGKKRRVIRIGGQFQHAGKPNANGRIYPRNVLEEAVSSLQEDIQSRRILGEYDHPPDAKIHLDRVSHLITKLWMEGDRVFGEAEVLADTICGAQLKALLENKINVGISSRGVGDMETTMFEGEEYYKVMPGYSFVTFDMVAEPSVRGSYMNVLSSSKNNQAVRVAESVEKETVICTKKDKESLIVIEAGNMLRGLLNS
jgi:hypothetical protein